LEVELPRDIDKELTDRPYFWMWAEVSGEEVQPSVLRLAFEPGIEVKDNEKTEYVPLGSFRLNKIFAAAKRRGVCTRQYERVTTHKAPLSPVLLARVKICCISDQCRQRMRVFAINLTNWHVYCDCEQLLERTFSEQPGTAAYEPPTVPLSKAWATLKDDIMHFVLNDDHTWANEATHRLDAEAEQLNTYYNSLILSAPEGESTDRYAQERDLRRDELEWRCQPRIEIEPSQFAMLYVAITP